MGNEGKKSDRETEEKKNENIIMPSTYKVKAERQKNTNFKAKRLREFEGNKGSERDNVVLKKANNQVQDHWSTDRSRGAV